MEESPGKMIRKAGKAVCLLCTLCILTLGFQCKEDLDPEFVFMTFILPFQVSPGDSILSRNDTVWIEADMPDTIYEKYSGQYYRLPNFNFKTVFMLHKLVGTHLASPDQPGATSDFDIVNKIGAVMYPRGAFAEFDYQYYRSGRYRCKIGLVPRETGVYSFNFLMPMQLHEGFDEGLHLTNEIQLERAPNGAERIPVYESLYFVINDGNTNFSLFQKHCDALSITNPTESNIYYEQKGTFTFRVVD